MADKGYPYTTVPGKLRDLLTKAPTMGRPTSVTTDWLKQAGWTSSNDRSMIPVLKFVGLVGSDSKPTPLWDAIRVKDQARRAQLASAIRESYADLFALYPDAHRKDGEALRNFFRAHSSGGEQVQGKLVQTFQALAEFADFDAQAPAVAESPPAQAEKQSPKPKEGKPEASDESSRAAGAASFPGVALNVNIQLQLPATSDGEVYEKLFGAMRKHLIGLSASE